MGTIELMFNLQAVIAFAVGGVMGIMKTDANKIY